MPDVKIFTDGACRGNPGPGGYGILLIYGKHKKELSGGFKHTTNNRMELIAVIKALKALKKKCNVELFSDSKYIVDAMQNKWAHRWQANYWKRNKRESAENPDLWEEILNLCDKHVVTFRWVKGHGECQENNRCDELAVLACDTTEPENDLVYEKKISSQKSLF
ncbi:ribonuclease HI [Candidatus Riflebacteria bacterium]